MKRETKTAWQYSPDLDKKRPSILGSVPDRTFDGCWLPTTASFMIDGAQIRTHRAMFVLMCGPVAEEYQLERTCGTKRCAQPEHYILVRARGRISRPMIARLYDKILVGDDCWEWIGSKDSQGYGNIRDTGPRGTTRTLGAHRVVYELLVGPIPEGLELDHLCRNPSCVRPAHLEPVTPRENKRRGEGICATNARRTHCPAGHLLEAPNLVASRLPHRACRECHLTVCRAYKERKRATTEP